MTPLELREKGYQALISQLGPMDTIRFLQQMGWGTGDYTQERQEHLQSVTREDFGSLLQGIRQAEEQ